MNKSKQKKKIRFSRCAVCLMYINVIGLFVYVAMTKDYPPTAFIIAWMGFWCVQAIVTAVLEINKRGNNKQISFVEAALPYINEENINALIERYLDITPTYRKAKKVKKLEEEIANE